MCSVDIAREWWNAPIIVSMRFNSYSSMKLHNLRVGDGEVDRQVSETTQRSCPKTASICLYVSTRNRTRREYLHVQCSLLLERSTSLLAILGHRCPGRKARRHLWTSGIRQIIIACSASGWNVSDEWWNECREHHSFLLYFSITMDLHRHDSEKIFFLVNRWTVDGTRWSSVPIVWTWIWRYWKWVVIWRWLANEEWISVVAREIYERCLRPRGLLCDKTRLMVTHQREYLVECDQTIVLVNSQIEAQGVFDQLSLNHPNIGVADQRTKEDEREKKSILPNMWDATSIVVDERSDDSTVPWSVWSYLFTNTSLGWLGVCVLIVSEALFNVTNYEIALWSRDSQSSEEEMKTVGFVYSILVVLNLLMIILRAYYCFHLLPPSSIICTIKWPNDCCTHRCVF